MNIVVVSPHPDDETLGAGGFLLRQKAAGDKIFWLNITDVQTNQGWDESFVERRKIQIQSICDFYNFDGFYNLQFKPSELDKIERGIIISKISECFKVIRPEWIILPDSNDAHSDHGIVFECCMACSKIFRYPYIKRIMTMEILSESDFGGPDHPFIPNYFIDITEHIEEKWKALQIYDTELGEPPFPRSIEIVKALSMLRGAAAGTKYAEAFKIIKFIE